MTKTGKQNKGSKAYLTLKAVLKAAIEVKNCRKCSASDSDSSRSRDDNSSDEEPPKHHHRKKVKPAIEEDEEVDNELEGIEVEVVDSEEPGEEPEDEGGGHSQKVTKLSAKC